MADEKTIIKKEEHWSIEKEIEARMNELGKLNSSADNRDARKAALDALEQAQRIQIQRTESAVKITKDITTVVLFGVLIALSFKMDKSDVIPQNKLTMGLLNKFFHI